MTTPTENLPIIEVYSGYTFEIPLVSQTGSTGYSWALSFMPDNVSLLDIRHEASNSAVYGSKTQQVFVFAAVKEGQSYIQFNLIRVWEPLKVAQSQAFELKITEKPKTLEEDLESSTGHRNFAAAESTNRSRSPMPYGFPHRVAQNPENCILGYGIDYGIYHPTANQ